MLTRETMEGLYVLVITPFDAKFRLDEEAYRENIRKLVNLGVHGIVTTGTNGEFFVVTDQELQRITRITVEECRNRAAVIIGASAVNTDESIRRSQIAMEEGADAVMNVIPFYQTLSKPEAYQYFKDLAGACPQLGIIVYNNPTTSKVRFDDNDFVRLQEIPTFCGSKMLGADVALYLNCLRRTKLRHFPLELLWWVSHCVGGNGVMASFIYAFPGFMMKWWQAIRKGESSKSLAMQHECNRILQEAVLPLAAEGYNDTALTKATVDAAGFF
ncbi:MAG TPA: dihydrodipicolinate synthase family protein, partial [Acidobacteriota bacterium]